MLPNMDGFSICKHLREKLDIPILMVTAKKEDIDKIRGLDTYDCTEITIGSIKINQKSHHVFVKDKELNLKNKEYELLLFLVTNADMVFIKKTLY